MRDRELAIEILKQISSATSKICHRFAPINSVADFTDSDAGMEKLDAICMQLIAVGESLKNLDKVTDGELLTKYPSVEWKRAMALRDIITHHYFDVNAEAIFDICESKIPALANEIKQMLTDLLSNN